MTFNAGQRILSSYINSLGGILISTQKPVSASPVTFSSIPATYTHLQLKWHCRTTSGNTSDNVTMQVNGDTGANYDWQIFTGTNTTAASTPGIGQTAILCGTAVGGTGTAGFFSNGELDIQGWSQAASGHTLTVNGKWYACWSGTAATSQVGTMGGLWVPSGVPTSLSLQPAAGTFASGSVFSLYGFS